MAEVTLTEFLLARLRDEEALANKVAESKGRIPQPAYGDSFSWWALAYAANPARVLAECEAKRQIIHLLEQEASAYDLECGGDLTRDILGPLAQPYADHPDFRVDWLLT